MEAALIREVRRRAKNRCEYCQFPQEYDDRSFEIDHIISRKHQGSSDAGNLALSCFRCNSFKGTDIAGLEPRTRRLAALYNSRNQQWGRHFRWEGAYLIGRTAIGRVTVALLQINDGFRVGQREALIEEGLFPPA